MSAGFQAKMYKLVSKVKPEFVAAYFGYLTVDPRTGGSTWVDVWTIGRRDEASGDILRYVFDDIEKHDNVFRVKPRGSIAALDDMWRHFVRIGTEDTSARLPSTLCLRFFFFLFFYLCVNACVYVHILLPFAPLSLSLSQILSPLSLYVSVSACVCVCAFLVMCLDRQCPCECI